MDESSPGITLKMNHPVIIQYFDTLIVDTDTVWCIDTSISIPFDLDLAQISHRVILETGLVHCRIHYIP